MVYFTADSHFGSKNIISLTQRPFENVQIMNKILVENYNSMITNNDVVYFLGDIASEISIEEIRHIISELNGHKILIKGNHDIFYDYENIFDEVCEYKMLECNGITFVTMHYPLLSWFDSRKGSVMLHGHIHAKKSYNIKNQSMGLRRFDIGLDANGYFPVSINQIENWLKFMPDKTEFNLIEHYLDAVTLAE